MSDTPNAQALPLKGSRFPALGHRNFRNYWLAQSVSLVGSWMQSLSLPWVAYTMSASPFFLGLVSAIQFTPLLVLSLPAGAVVDRADRRKLVLLSQVVLAGLSLMMAIFLFTKVLTYPLLLIIAFLMGTFQALDFPGRQALLHQIVHKEHITNAVALNSSVFNAARIIGPALAGIVMATWGPLWCFVINGASYLPVILVLLGIRVPVQDPQPSTTMVPGGIIQSIKDAFGHVMARPVLAWILLLTAVMGIFAVNHAIILPIKISQGMVGGEKTFALLISSMGIGSFLSAFLLAARGKKIPLTTLMPVFALGAAVFMVVLSFTSHMLSTALAMVGLGITNVAFFTTANASLQHHSSSEFRGRIMAMYALVFGGLTPLGSLLVGITMEFLPASLSFLVCALAVLVSMGLLLLFRRQWLGKHPQA